MSEHPLQDELMSTHQVRTSDHGELVQIPWPATVTTADGRRLDDSRLQVLTYPGTAVANLFWGHVLVGELTRAELLPANGRGRRPKRLRLTFHGEEGEETLVVDL